MMSVDPASGLRYITPGKLAPTVGTVNAQSPRLKPEEITEIQRQMGTELRNRK
jgi:hypothetical protein